MQELIEVDDGDRRLSTLVVRPLGTGPFPVVIMFSHGPGLSPEIQLSGQRVAAAGYAVVMIDRYNRQARLLSYDQAELLASPQEAKEFRKLIYVVTDDDVSADLAAVMRRIRHETWAGAAPWGVMGFGIGVRSVIRTMAAHPELFVAGAGFYPTACVTDERDSPHRTVPCLRGRLYLGMPGSDCLVPTRHTDALAAALECLGERGGYDVFPGAEHGFAVPGFQYDRAAADRGFQAALRLYSAALVW